MRDAGIEYLEGSKRLCEEDDGLSWGILYGLKLSTWNVVFIMLQALKMHTDEMCKCACKGNDGSDDRSDVGVRAQPSF